MRSTLTTQREASNINVMLWNPAQISVPRRANCGGWRRTSLLIVGSRLATCSDVASSPTCSWTHQYSSCQNQGRERSALEGGGQGNDPCSKVGWWFSEDCHILSAAHTCLKHGTFEAYLSSGKFELWYNWNMLHIQTYYNSNFPLLKYASNVPCFMQVCAALKGMSKECLRP